MVKTRSRPTGRVVAGAALLLAACAPRGRPPAPDGSAPEPLALTPLAATPELRWAFPCDVSGHYPVVDPRARLHPLFRSLQDVPGCFPLEDETGGAYLLAQGWLTCVDAHTGERRWTFPIRSSDAQCAADSGFLFVYDLSGEIPPFAPARAQLSRLDPRDGSLRGAWQGLPPADLVRFESGRVVMLSRYAITVMDGMSGRVLWSRAYSASGDAAMEVLDAAVGASGLALQLRSARRSLPELAFWDLDTATPRWSKEGRPLSVQSGHVISVNPESRGFAVRGALDGAEVRADALEGWVEGHEVCADGLLFYVARQWVIEPARVAVGPAGAADAPPAYTPRLEMLARDLGDGTVRWFLPWPPDDPHARFFAAGDRVGMITRAPGGAPADAERMTIHDAATGVPLWSADVPSGIVKVHVRKDRALIRSHTGWVHCVEWLQR